MLFGSLIVSDVSGYWVIAALIGIIIVLAKIPLEEKLMLETFGEQSVAYQKQVPQLILGLRWLKKS